MQLEGSGHGDAHCGSCQRGDGGGYGVCVRLYDSAVARKLRSR